MTDPPTCTAPAPGAARHHRRPLGAGRRPGWRLPTTASLVMALAACAPGVSVAEAPHGADPVCASVVLALPDQLGDLPRLRTTSQASAAWGTPAAHVVLRCGVEVPGPTTVHCVSVDTPDGPSIDWLALADDPAAQGATSWTFTTYGRDPAVEVRVPAAVASSHSTSFLDQLGPAIAQVEPTRACL
ncbi:MAG TPA: DUF3515 domain-containing protein [Cellulomonas sp.]|uniref:DUF3515 domain-containing protein n=1 Tax=Cellulomonas sp. TaxID=40001 RepID=UPI002E2FEC92|nr:DUF3515 domain-containing protein [Cellulomonas sp.]HEX5332325.1 DUF3515 domain-containing protein [Cellulomonas sp.]